MEAQAYGSASTRCRTSQPPVEDVRQFLDRVDADITLSGPTLLFADIDESVVTIEDVAASQDPALSGSSELLVGLSVRVRA
jgi:hypothetical protein